MPPVKMIQTAFDSGKYSPRMDGRVDTEGYRNACKRLENFIVFPQGGAITRSGSKFVANTKNNGAARLIPFVISTISAYVLEFGNEYIRFYKTGAQQLSGVDSPNKIANPGFETGDFTGWTQNDGVITSSVHSGFFASVVGGGSAEDGPESDKIDIDITKTYRVDAWYNIVAWSANEYEIEINFYNSADALISSTTMLSIAAATPVPYTELTKTIGSGQDIEFPANTAKISINSKTTGASVAGRMDDVLFVETNAPVEIVSPYLTADLFEIDFAQTNDIMYITHPDHAPRKLSRISDDEWILHEVNFNTEPLIDDFFAIDDPTTMTQVPTPAAFEAGKTAFFSDTDNTNFSFIDGDIGRILFAGQRKAQILWVSTGAPTQVITARIIDQFITDDTSFSAGELSIAGTPFGSLNPSTEGTVGSIITLTSDVNGNTASRLLGSWVASAVGSQYYWNVNPTTEPDEIAWHGDFLNKNSGGLAGGLNLAEWGYGDVDTLGFNTIYIRTPLNVDPETLDNTQDENAIQRVDTTGSVAELFRKEDEGKFVQIHGGLVEITTFVAATSVRGRVLRVLDAATGTTNWILSTSYWKSGDYPGAVVFHENRLIFGGSPSFPNVFWGSAVGADKYENFQPGTSDADSYAFALNARQSSLIRWLESRDIMIAGLEDSEWQLGLRNGIITPSSIFVRRQTIHGSANIQSVVAEKSILFIERGGDKLRELNFDFESDSYIADDKTLLAEDVGGASGFKQIDVQNRPFPVIWGVNNDGQLVGMTYIRNQNLSAWHVHETGATAAGVSDGSDNYESVAVIPNISDETVDEVWVVVNRIINGNTVRFVEQFEKPLDIDAIVTDPRSLDAFIVDTGLTTTVSGLTHLIGDTVTAVIDGDPDKIETLTVDSDGEIELSEAPTVNVVVGLPYTPLIQTMRTDAPGPTGTTQAQIKRINKVWLRLFNSLGLECGDIESNTSPLNLAKSHMVDADDPDKYYTFAADGLFTGDVEFEDYAGGNNRKGFVFIVQTLPLPATVAALVLEVETT